MTIRAVVTTAAQQLMLAAILGSAVPAPAQDCVGDCNGTGTVEVNELVIGVNIALGNQPLSACPSFDCDGTGTVPVSCLVQGVNNALEGCGGGDCPLQAGVYTITQIDGGTLRVSTFAPFPFPAGGTLNADVGNGNASCVHPVVLPFPGGFSAPAFCIPAFGFTASLTQTGCGIGQIDSDGGGDYTVTEIGDTSSQPECNNQQVCNDGVDSRVRLDVTVGDGTSDSCTSGSANMVLTVPVETVVWLENSEPAECPASDGMYNPGQDTLILQVPQILDFTTDTARTAWEDLSGDGCPLAGAGPAVGFMNTGSCWDLAAGTVSLAAGGAVGSASPPLYDFGFVTSLPNTVTGPQPSEGATCTTPPVIDFGGTAIRCIE